MINGMSIRDAIMSYGNQRGMEGELKTKDEIKKT
jgi:hypothetical protein